MKKTIIRKIIACVMSVVLVMTMAFTNSQPITVSAATQAVKPLSPERKQFANQLEKKMAIDEELYKWAQERKEEEKERPTKEKLEKMEAALNLANESAPFIINSIKDIADGGDFDTAEFVSGIADLASGILACIVPWGTVASIGLSLAKNLLMTFMGGEDGPSEVQLMEDRLNQRLDEIADQISEVQTQLTEMSDQINESTELIISSVSTEIEGQSDKNHLRDFMLSSGKDDFSYNQFRNYIYGTTSDNRNGMTAYYAQLQKAQLGGGTSEEIKHYYDLLYSALVDNRTSFHDYITGDGFGKSIVATYYDVLSKRPDLTEKMGMSAEMATVQFAYDLYQTEMMMDQIILACNNYQYTQMVIENVDEYNYGTGTVLASEILNEQKESVIAQSLKVGIDELRMQFAEDLVYVMEITDTYSVEMNGEFYYHTTTEVDGVASAPVLEGQTVYLNRVPATTTALFDLDAEAFKYEGRGMVDDDGIINVSQYNTTSTISLVYTDTNDVKYNISSIKLTDGELADFAGGVGSEDSPYLIATADQFLNIADDMGAYYRLTNDINFENDEINSIGYSINTVDAEVYEEFTGVLDGDGFTVYGVNIHEGSNSGLFAKIGVGGEVCDLTVSNAKINIDIDEAKKTTTTFTGGIITGTNNGSIHSCVVKDSVLRIKSNTDNADAERTVYFKYGGVAGVNNGEIVAAMVEDTEIDVSSTHKFGGADTSTNKNNVFVGGICGTCPGTLDYVSVDKDVKLRAYAKSSLSPKSTVNPYLQAYAGGITTTEGLDKDNLSNISSAAVASNVTAAVELQINSAWGKHWKNAKAKTDVYIAKFPQKGDKGFDEKEDYSIADLKVDANTVKNAFAKKETYKTSIVDNTEKYPIGALELNQDKLDIEVNSEAVEEFCILNMYGFSTYNDNYNNTRTVEIIMLFTANIDGVNKLLTGVFSITVEKNRVESIEVINYKDVYLKGEAVDTKAMIEVSDVNGKTTTVNDAKITVKNAQTATAEIGTKTLEVSYQDVSCTVEIEVLCDVHYKHFDFDNTQHYTFVKSVAATCEHGGYDEYVCLGCNQAVTTNRTGAVDHKRVRDISKEATCAETGVIGKIYCEYCDTVFEEQVELPKLAHNIVSEGNSENHYCTECKKSYSHDYVVLESIVDGKVTYTYTCSTCGYVGKKNDTNIITDEERLRPIVVVSDGFALKGGEQVKVYVDLENNPGVNGANFGIRYDERLELVQSYEGEFFANTATEASHAVSCGYNYVWGNEATRTEKGGNLLELVFRLPEDAMAEDRYDVSVVYSVVAGSEGGFSLPNDVCAALGIPSNAPQKFKTKDGVIRIVDRLPGDIDNNNVVNLLDALYLSNCLVNQEQYPITHEIRKYGDINLDGKVTVNDVVKILQSISGGYGASLLSHEYRIHLNTNGYNYQPTALDVCLYGANNTYSALALIEQEMKQREGYEFLGWYTRLEGGEKIDAENYETTLVSYDQDQKVQTLYAHWEKNSVSFDMNGATSSALDKETYLGNGAQLITLSKPVEEYTIIFVDPNNVTLRKTEKMSREFTYWLGSDGNKYYAGEQFPVHKANMGELTLTAQWDEWQLSFPSLEKTGYDSSKITWYTNNLVTDKLNDKVDGKKYKNVYEVIKAMPEKVLYAEWTAPITYYVKYDANGGSGTMTNSEHKYDSAKQLSNNAFINEYKVTFNYGWSGQSNSSVTQRHTFQHWSRDGKYPIQDNLVNNWTSVDGTVITVYAVWDVKSVTLPTPDLDSRTGYTFQGWYTDANFTNIAGTTGQAGSSFETTKECTLYAKWKANEYTVAYNLNTMGSNNAAANNSDQCYSTPTWSNQSNADAITYEKTGTYLDLPQTDLYNFVGWFTAPVGGTKITDNTGKVINATAITVNNTQLYAHWTKSLSGTYVYDEASLKAITTTGTYHIVKDITLAADWTPISTFSGTIDGHGHTITNVNYLIRTSGSNSVVDFGFVRVLTGTIKNVIFNKLGMTIVKSKDGIMNNNVGGVAGTVQGGTLDNVHMISPGIWGEHHRDVVTSGDHVNANVGGIAGFMSSGTIKNCSVSGSGSVWSIGKKATKSADAHAYAGGIVGYMTGGTVSGCSRSDGVSVTSQSEVNSKNSASRSGAGGIIGVRDGGTYTGCTSTANNVNAKVDNGSTANSSWRRSGAIVGSGA